METVTDNKVAQLRWVGHVQRMNNETAKRLIGRVEERMNCHLEEIRLRITN